MYRFAIDTTSRRFASSSSRFDLEHGSLVGLQSGERAAEPQAREACPILQRAPRGGPALVRHVLERVERAIDFAQLGDDPIDEGRPQRQGAEDRCDLGVRLRDRLPERCPCSRGRSLVGATATALVESSGRPLDPFERRQDRIDVLRLQLAPVRQENQLRGGRRPGSNTACEADKSAHGARQGRQRALHGTARFFDAATQFLLLACLEQRALSDVAKIHAHEIELLVRHAGGHGSIAVVSIGIFSFRVGDRLIVEGFGILFAKKPVGRLGTVFGGFV